MLTKNYFEKRFLNKDGYHSLAGICIDINFEEDSSFPFYMSLAISNCDRSIELSFDNGSLENYDNNIYKLTQLKEVLENATKFLVENREIYNQELKNKEENDKVAEVQ